MTRLIGVVRILLCTCGGSPTKKADRWVCSKCGIPLG